MLIRSASQRWAALHILAIFALSLASVACAQATEGAYTRRNSFGVLTAFSFESGRISEGSAEDRYLLNIGVSYNRRLYANHWINWQYDGELLPVALDSDPVQVTVTTFDFGPETVTSTTTEPTERHCRNNSGSATLPNGDSYSYVGTCSRRWVIGEAFSPVGFLWNFLPRHKLQPFFIGHGGIT